MTYKKANTILIGISTLCLLLIALFLLSPAIADMKSCRQLKGRLQLAIQSSNRSTELKKEIAATDKLLLSGDKNKDATRDVLAVISSYCEMGNTLVLRSFPKTIVTKRGDYLLETHVFTMEGSYSDLLEMVYRMEQKEKLGRIASLKFGVKEDYKTNRKSLMATIFLQTIKKSI